MELNRGAQPMGSIGLSRGGLIPTDQPIPQKGGLAMGSMGMLSPLEGRSCTAMDMDPAAGEMACQLGPLTGVVDAHAVGPLQLADA